MTVLTFATNDLFVARVTKSHTANPDRKWQNSYEFVANSSGALGDLQDMAESLVSYEQAIHNTFTRIEQVTVATWGPDSVPYDPDVFFTEPIGLNGTRDTTGELEPLNVCWSVSRDPLTGRVGHIFYRGVLAQADTEAPSGILQLSDPAGMITELSAARTGSGFDNYMGPAATTPVVVAMVNKTGTNIRTVQIFTSAGVALLPVDHAWFNRTP
jgi:hypothetical protein